MIQEEIDMHLAAGRYFGQLATCGRKIRHPDEQSAAKHAKALNSAKNRTHEVEAYPCYWCNMGVDWTEGEYTWHVGRAMPPEERRIWDEVARFYTPSLGSS
jgi:hypothetical protein